MSEEVKAGVRATVRWNGCQVRVLAVDGDQSWVKNASGQRVVINTSRLDVIPDTVLVPILWSDVEIMTKNDWANPHLVRISDACRYIWNNEENAQ